MGTKQGRLGMKTLQQYQLASLTLIPTPAPPHHNGQLAASRHVLDPDQHELDALMADFLHAVRHKAGVAALRLQVRGRRRARSIEQKLGRVSADVEAFPG